MKNVNESAIANAYEELRIAAECIVTGTSYVDFEWRGVTLEGDNYVKTLPSKVPDCYGIYGVEKDGEFNIPIWLDDVPSKAFAMSMVGMLKEVLNDLCPTCKGYGVVGENPFTTCPNCHGACLMSIAKAEEAKANLSIAQEVLEKYP